ncbi:Uncharacterized membrane protein YckC, RDD family [Actinopolyspora xinjiangensis]|uniref:Uncharacterized membrane protein YckC, RDD family n=1 Tax=Actinopolyspora xinjiangensis TaxID=405564 RepID=A0A1H0UBY3_9ACTN|nr:RDD family protein [Actinopolyspora xinjiangensis]SDP63699.1 Uncharacterized membrane protein YckC, RDD family [Actinopolyspora xinjiangensis]
MYDPFAHWGVRVVGYLIDGLIVFAAFLAPALLGVVIGSLVMIEGFTAAGAAIMLTFALLGLLCEISVVIWDLVYLRGTTGQTVGQRIMRIKTVDEFRGRPIGFGYALLRQLCHVVDALPLYMGFFAPLWEPRKQTWADRIVKTVVVHVDPPTDGVPEAGHSWAGPPGTWYRVPPPDGVPPRQ